MKKDIKNRKDIEKLVHVFYGKVMQDPLISYFFNDVTRVNWENHLPKMSDFFENILLSSGNYEGNPMDAHEGLHKKSEVKSVHFQRWNDLLDETVNDLFAGTKADELKHRGANIAAAMMHKAHR